MQLTQCERISQQQAAAWQEAATALRALANSQNKTAAAADQAAKQVSAVPCIASWDLT